MNSRTISLALNTGDTISGILSTPGTSHPGKTTGIVFAHGAANDMNNPVIVAAADGLARAGYTCLRFNFPYREKNKKSPDPEHRLVHAWQQAIAFLQDKDSHYFPTIIAVGKSLGARIASQAAAAGEIHPDRLIFLGYPLHAPGKKENLRDAHLYKIPIPMLFFEGTRDPFCDLAILEKVFKKLTCPRELEIIDGADHSFKLPTSDPRPEDAVHEQIIEKCLKWIPHD
jgi:predicted alpha/beta-hydrolase family hydrolase